MVEFSVPAYREFLAALQDRKNKVAPPAPKFKVSESGNAPWYERPEVNKERIEELARKYSDRPAK
jgi:hypothetical protein